MIPVSRLPVSPKNLEWALLPQNPASCSLPLHFLAGPEEAFRPAEASVWWTEGALWILASLTDDEPVCSATEDNQRLWELGDVFETFLKIGSSDDYLELHVSPTGRRLQLRFPNPKAVARLRASELSMTDLIVADPLFDFLVRPISGGWQVLSRIPDPRLVAGSSVLLSCSRYDAAPGRAPVLSSTSRHAEVNFHRQQEWTPLMLAD